MPAAAILIKTKRGTLEFACSCNNTNEFFISTVLLAECRAMRCTLTSIKVYWSCVVSLVDIADGTLVV